MNTRHITSTSEAGWQPPQNAAGPGHSAQITRINRIQGQLEGIKKMIGDGRYCPVILAQTAAVRAAVRSLEALLLEKHLDTCLRRSFEEGGSEEKIRELLTLFRKQE